MQPHRSSFSTASTSSPLPVAIRNSRALRYASKAAVERQSSHELAYGWWSHTGVAPSSSTNRKWKKTVPGVVDSPNSDRDPLIPPCSWQRPTLG